MQRLAGGILGLVLISFLVACEPTELGEEMPLTLYRRSVLDQRPRMLTLRFGDQHFLAYDLKKMQPVKVWNGGVLWNGAVFNSTKTVQPTSYGDTYDLFPTENFWKLKKGDEDLQIDVQFNSYQLEDNGILFKYTISGAGQKIEIVESPEVSELGDSIKFSRLYEIAGLPATHSLFAGVEPVKDKSIISSTYLKTATPAKPEEITSGNGAQYWLDKSGCSTCHDAQNKMIGPSYVEIADRYAAVEDAVTILVSRVQNGSTGEWGFAQMIPHLDLNEKDLTNMVKYILSLEPIISQKEKVPAKKKVFAAEDSKPGFRAPVAGVHPAYELIDIRPEDFKPGVGGMAFLPDGSLVVSTWDSLGAIYRISGLGKDNPDSIAIKMIASGLAESLGVTTVEDDIYVLQKHELTKLIDHDKDGITDEYVCVNNQFGVTTDFHEFSYGLVHLNGRFYGGLGLAMRLMSSEEQLEDRGAVFSVSNSQDFEIIARGFRQTNGIGVGPDGSIFVTENQGQWVPGCKLIQVKSGAFYGCQFGTGDRFRDQVATPPTVWLPQDEIGNSPGEPIVIRDGPYAGQMMHGDVTHGGIKRVYLEQRNGEYQGCVFRFCQGLEAGINRLAYGPDGGLYAGGVGMNGGWSHKERRFGLQKLRYNNKVPFEMLSVSSTSDGFDIQFTAPVNSKINVDHSKINIKQWHYEATPAYGGPKLGLEDLTIKNVIMSDDRTLIKLKIDGLKKGNVVYFLLSDELKNESGEGLWSGEAWYTLNNFSE